MRQRLIARAAVRVTTAFFEVAVVLTVLVVLAMVGLQALHGLRTDVSAVSCRADKRNVLNASAAYLAERGVLAESVDALVTAGFLDRPPGGPGYRITYQQDGTVTASGACS